MENSQIKIAVTAAGGAAAAFVEPVLPVAGLCTVMVLADVATALRLRGRLRRSGKAVQAGLLSSKRFGRAVRTIAGIYGALCVAHGADLALGDTMSFLTGGHSALNMMGMLIFVWQLMSVLENEATCSGSAWASKARKYLADKTERHLDGE